MEKLFTDGGEEFRQQWRKRQQKLQGVIALKGLPYTWKSRLAELIGEWATCPVFCIDDFLCYQNELAAAYDFSPCNSSGEQVQRHHHHAFITLCAVAKRHLRPKFGGQGFNSVVIKSRLTSTLELDQLTELTQAIQFGKGTFPLLIIECQMRNEFRWEIRSRFFANRARDWYRPVNWKEMEQARDEYYDPQSRANWDDNIRRLVERVGDDPPLIRVLVIDPFSDINFTSTRKTVRDLTSDGFFDAVKYLLTSDNQELNHQNPYVVEFDELRRFLFDRELNAAALRPRSKYLCLRGDCLFKYWTSLQDNEPELCRVCDERVSGPAYTCYFCSLTLHKSCAEMVSINNTLLPSDTNTTILEYFYDYNKRKFSETHSCLSCIERGAGFSKECGSCLFETHLKCGLVSTIINHKCHTHFLSIQFHQHSFVCKACGMNYSAYSYGCKRCAWYYHLECATLPGELMHEHGGYEHEVKLMYSRDGMEPEESYWCDGCYADMDPQGWFYWCQECPYYGACPHCAGGYDVTYAEIVSLSFGV